jgi:hypothetical protein
MSKPGAIIAGATLASVGPRHGGLLSVPTGYTPAKA